MNRCALLILVFGSLFWPVGQAAEVMSELLLKDGSRLKGRVVSTTDTEATVMSDFGVLRIALDKLTPESRASLLAQYKPDPESMLRRIKELEAQVAQLQQENANLRRQAVANTPSPVPSRTQSLTPQLPASESGMAYTISSTGKRHNSGCRYFRGGRACGPNEGIGCKICGG